MPAQDLSLPAIDQLRLLEQTIQRLRRIAERRRHNTHLQTALYKIADLVSNDSQMTTFFYSLHQVVRGLMYAENFFIALFDEGCDSLSYVYYADSVDIELDLSSLQNIPLAQLRGTMTQLVLSQNETICLDAKSMALLEQQGILDPQISGAPCIEWLGTPLKIGQRCLGIIAVQSYDSSKRFHRADRKLLTYVAKHIATAVDRKQNEIKLQQAKSDLEHRVDERTAELKVINATLAHEFEEREKSERLRSACYEIAEQSFSVTDLSILYQFIHQTIDHLIDAKNFYIALYDPSSGKFEIPYLVDNHFQAPSPRIIPVHELAQNPSFTTRVLLSGRPVLLNTEEIKASRRQDEWFIGTESAWLGVPLIIDGLTSGAVVVQSHEEGKRYSAEDVELLEFVSTHIATAIKRRSDADSLKLAHASLREHYELLEQKISERTQALSETNAMLEQLLEQRRQINDKLAHDAHHDALTGLPNRSLFLERLAHAIKRNIRTEQISFAVLFLDLDRFKVINDSLGHMMGDRLLCEVSTRLMQCVRPGDTVARLGGDEFCILLDGISDIDSITQIAERILKKIAEPFTLNSQRIFSSTSIGITLSTQNYDSPDACLRDADVAMYQAKSSGKNKHCQFDPSMHQSVIDRMKLESELRHAIARNEIFVYFQPIIDLRNNTVRGFEALARWKHPNLGMVSPAQFIPLAEETGLINDLGLFILREAVRQVKQWQIKSGMKNLYVSVNLSGRQLSQRNLLAQVEAVLKGFDFNAENLKLEVTESLLIHNFESAQALLKALQKMNIEILLDDFGTGYSSLKYLHEFPLNTVKIDRTFVSRIIEHEKSRELLNGIKLLTQKLGLTLVAEGVEYLPQAELLRSMGIEFGQGYFFGAPMGALQAEQFLGINTTSPTSNN